MLTRKQKIDKNTNNKIQKKWQSYEPGNKKQAVILTRKQETDRNTNQET